MKKIYFLLIIFFVTLLLMLFVFYNKYASYYEEEQINSYISKNIDILNENLNFEKRYALSLSLYISKNETIKKALHVNNQTLALKEIDAFLKEIKDSTAIENIDIQIHTKELKAFARNWDHSDYLGANLSTFRKGLVQVKKTQKSFVSIELGKRLNIKAISPIHNNNGDFIGSVEIIINFKNIENRLSKFDLEMLTLLDKDFINIAVDLKNHQKIDKYYIVEEDYSKKLFALLKQNTDIFKQEKFYYIIKDKIIVFVPMLSVGIDDIGVIVLSMINKNHEISTSINQNLYFQNNSYKFNNNKREVIIK